MIESKEDLEHIHIRPYINKGYAMVAFELGKKLGVAPSKSPTGYVTEVFHLMLGEYFATEAFDPQEGVTVQRCGVKDEYGFPCKFPLIAATKEHYLAGGAEVKICPIHGVRER